MNICTLTDYDKELLKEIDKLLYDYRIIGEDDFKEKMSLVDQMLKNKEIQEYEIESYNEGVYFLKILKDEMHIIDKGFDDLYRSRLKYF